MKNTKKDIFVIGHKNPDTDSICSAIAYAYLKNQLSENKYIPKRAGQVSSETSFVLQAFKTKVPTYINDVRTQVKDAIITESERVPKNMSLKNAWSILNEKELATLAVVGDKGELEGLITVGDIAKSFMGVYDSYILSNAKTPYKNILETIKGDLITGDDKTHVTHGKTLVAAANPDLMEEYIEPGDIVILGDRYESQMCAVEMNASCLIVCVGGEISPGIIRLAKEKGCTIIRTEYDTFIVSRLLNQSVPIEHFMVKEHLITFKQDDFIEDIRNIMAQKRHRDFPVLDNNGKFIGFLSRHGLMNTDKKELILVDHNEANQAVDGIEDAKILEIIDHHKLGHVQTLEPVLFRNQPVGATATIVYMMFKENRVDIPKPMAGLLCSAILSDTLMYRSPTCTPIDKMAAEELAKISRISVEAYAKRMFTAGSNLKSKSAQDIFYQDFKKFMAGNISFGVGQITSMTKEELDEALPRLIAFMTSAKENHSLDMMFFMLTNIMEESTYLLCAGKGALEAVENAFGNDIDEHGAYLKGVVSRKKQLIPKLMSELQR